MMSSWWVWWVAGAVGVAILGGLRWALADFLLDQFGSRRWTVSEHRQPSEFESAGADVSRGAGGDDDRRAGLEGLG